ncbi:DUF2505 domain-containing protein [Ferrimonas pelagia]|uniref:DUF2505 domain-containing protein n=1 Tax=Ferrimonas pelagia TaxID=1177826 RepID=A0ABP9F9Y6_9GAMM
MKLTLKHDYPCPVEQLLTHFIQADAVKEKYQAIGATKVRLRQSQQQDDQYQLATSREVQSQIPAALRSLVGERNLIEQSEQWQLEEGGPYRCQLSITLPGVPIRIRGQMQIEAVGDGCCNRVELEFKCALPFVGSKLERFACEDSQRMAEQERQYLLEQCQTQVE